MTLKEGIYDIREAMKLLSIDSDVTDRQISFLMRIYRATVIRQHITNNPGEHRDMLTQSLYMLLELNTSTRFPEYSSVGYSILSTVQALPNIIGQQMYKEYEVRIDSELGTEIEMMHKDRVSEYVHAPDGFIYGFREDNGKLYFISKNPSHKYLSRVIVSAILENPEDELNIHLNINELIRYPITIGLWGVVKDMIIQHIANEMNVPIDLLNDKKDGQLSEKA